MSKRAVVVCIIVSLLVLSALGNIAQYIDRYYTAKVLRELLVEVHQTYRDMDARLPDDIERQIAEAAEGGFMDGEKVLRLRDALRRRSGRNGAR